MRSSSNIILSTAISEPVTLAGPPWPVELRSHPRAPRLRLSLDTPRGLLRLTGALGAFRLRELDLKPGRYTVIGRRDGFRDVRMELDLAPGQRDAALSIQCTERI